MSRTRYAILGLLSAGPRSGYELKQFIDRGIAHFWSETYGNLYPQLRTLEELGYVTAREERRERGPDAIVYEITDAGRAALQAWLRTPCRDPRPRDELLLRLFFGHEVPLAISVNQLHHYLGQHKAALQQFAESRPAIEQEFAGHPHLPFWRISLRRGEIIAEARIRWAEESLRELLGPSEDPQTIP